MVKPATSEPRNWGSLKRQGINVGNSSIMISRAARDAISGAIQIDHENPHFKKWYGKHYNDVVVRLDLRRNVRATIPHEFLVIYRQARKPFRIDRRGDPYVPAQALTQLGCPAHDTIEPLDENALGGTYVAASMRCRAKEGGELYVDDLLAAIFAIANDEVASRYTIRHFNCYFMSRTTLLHLVEQFAAQPHAGIELSVAPVLTLSAPTFRDKPTKDYDGVDFLSRPQRVSIADMQAWIAACNNEHCADIRRWKFLDTTVGRLVREQLPPDSPTLKPEVMIGSAITRTWTAFQKNLGQVLAFREQAARSRDEQERNMVEFEEKRKVYFTSVRRYKRVRPLGLMSAVIFFDLYGLDRYFVTHAIPLLAYSITTLLMLAALGCVSLPVIYVVYPTLLKSQVIKVPVAHQTAFVTIGALVASIGLSFLSLKLLLIAQHVFNVFSTLLSYIVMLLPIPMLVGAGLVISRYLHIVEKPTEPVLRVIKRT